MAVLLQQLICRDMVWAKRPTLSQSFRRKSKETSTALTATLLTGVRCQSYTLAGISARG